MAKVFQDPNAVYESMFDEPQWVPFEIPSHLGTNNSDDDSKSQTKPSSKKRKVSKQPSNQKVKNKPKLLFQSSSTERNAGKTYLQACQEMSTNAITNKTNAPSSQPPTTINQNPPSKTQPPEQWQEQIDQLNQENHEMKDTI